MLVLSARARNSGIVATQGTTHVRMGMDRSWALDVEMAAVVDAQSAVTSRGGRWDED